MGDKQFNSRKKEILKGHIEHNLQSGVYEHYKGKRYRVIGVAKHSETLEKLVVYQKLYDDGGFWVRPFGMFMEEIEVSGKKVPRFRFISEN